MELFINAKMTSQFKVLHNIITNFYKTIFLNDRKVIKNKENLRNCPSQEEPRDMTKCNVVSWMRAWDRQKNIR